MTPSLDPKRWKTLALLCVAQFIVIIATCIMNVAALCLAVDHVDRPSDPVTSGRISLGVAALQSQNFFDAQP